MQPNTPTDAHVTDEDTLVHLVVTAIVTACDRAHLVPRGPIDPRLAAIIVDTAHEAVERFYTDLGTVRIVEQLPEVEG